MSFKKSSVVPLATALASLSGMAAAAVSSDTPTEKTRVDVTAKTADSVKPTPTGYFNVGGDLLGFVVTQQADGTVVAGHSSHSSHASHASHSSSR